jgi:hypothetical protein
MQLHANNPKVLLKIVIGMFFLLQMFAGIIVKNFYDRFTALEEETAKYDQEIETLKTDIKVIDALISFKGDK